jgi:MFS family permease
MADATTMSGAGAPPAAADRIDPRRLIAFLVMVFGMFMAILDIQIVSASLNEIQAGLAASSNEITWVQTSYLISEVVMIPLSGFLSRALGTRTLFAMAAAGFTAASLMCGFSTTINEMIIWRAIQGFIGGGMIPTVFASAYLIFPRSRMSLITPLIGLVATLAPTIGPTVGGYLTDQLSWHWLFFINVVPGILVTIGAITLIDFDKPDYSLFDNFDFIGLLSMAGFLGALEYVLEEGPRNDWFGDDTVLLLAWVSAISGVIFFARVLLARAPIVDLSAFTNRNFAIGSLFSFVLGIGLYGLTYIYPVYLAQIRGYNALMIGETMFVSGLAMFATAPLDAHGGLPVLRRRHLLDDLDHHRLGFLGAPVAADLPRRRPDAVDHPDQRDLARHAAAGAPQERVGALQPDAQHGRRLWPGRPADGAERPHRPASRPPPRCDHLVARPGRRDPQRHDPAVLRLRQRRASHGLETIDAIHASPGRGDGLCRPLPAADVPVRRPGASGPARQQAGCEHIGARTLRRIEARPFRPHRQAP